MPACNMECLFSCKFSYFWFLILNVRPCAMCTFESSTSVASFGTVEETPDRALSLILSSTGSGYHGNHSRSAALSEGCMDPLWIQCHWAFAPPPPPLYISHHIRPIMGKVWSASLTVVLPTFPTLLSVFLGFLRVLHHMSP